MSEKSSISITFTENAKLSVLNMLNKDVDKSGFVVEKENPDKKVISSDGNELNIDNFGGVKKGSEIFIEDNIVSIIKLLKR